MNARSFRPVLAWVVLATLCVSSAWARGTPEDTWRAADGKDVWRHQFDVAGNEPGVHNVIIRARDAAGNETVDGPYNIRIDPEAGIPTVRIVYPEPGTVLRRDIEVNGIAGGRIGIERVEVRLDEGPPETVEGTEYWSRSIDASGLRDGTHTLYARAVDSRGTEGPEVSVPFILDRSAPSVRITSHAAGALVSGSVTLEGEADDASGIASVALSTDGGERFESLKLKTDKGETAAAFSFPVPSRKLPDGAAIWQLRAEDRTGVVTIQPVLFFVDNEAPKLEILDPAENDTVFGTVTVTGTVSDAVGVERLSIDWGRESREIDLRPGDPYWTAEVDLSAETGRSVSLRVTVVDRSGNTASSVRRLQNDAAAASPVVEVSYPGPEILAAFPPDGAVYGHLSGGTGAASVVLEGTSLEFPAHPAFRIPPDAIPPGKSAELRIRGKNADGSLGTPLRVRVVRPPAAPDAVPPPLPSPSATFPSRARGMYSHFRDSFMLEGTIPSPGADNRLEYRLGPGEPWIELPADDGGAFSSEIRGDSLPDGPVHLELRTVVRGTGNAPVYHPLNRSTASPEIRIASPRAEDSVNGRVTVSGNVTTAAPIAELSYSLDGSEFLPLPRTAASVGEGFSVVVDFSALQDAGGRLAIRARDTAGNESVMEPQVQIDGTRDLPTVQLNLPQDGAVITKDFMISGMAFDDDGVAAVHWRIGEEEFRRVESKQNFSVEMPLSLLSSGEQKIEVYSEDMYGRTGEPVSARIRVSTDAPTVKILEPGIEIYNRGTVSISGSAADSNGIAEVRVSMDNGTTFQKAEGTESWSLSLNTAAYTDGLYSVLVVAADTFGVESRASSLLSIDNTPPEVSLGEPPDGTVSGASLNLSGRVRDNIEVVSLDLELASVSGEDNHLDLVLEPRLVVLESVDVSSLPPGEYNLRMVAVDLAGNVTVVARNVSLTTQVSAYRAVLFDPLPGVVRTGPLTVSGRVSGPHLPESVRILGGPPAGSGGPADLGSADVDRFGFFHFPLPDENFTEGRLDVSARYETPTGESVSSPVHSVFREPYGPVVVVDSHRTGDVITGRPWLSGRAWIELSSGETEAAGKRADKLYGVSRVQVSFDNGRSFEPAKGGEEWRFRLETPDLSQGPLPVLVRAEFADGRSAVSRIMLTVDTIAPSVSLVAPLENSRHAEELLVYGISADDYGVESIDVNLRPGDKSGYDIPQFIQGLYLDAHGLGATYGDFGVGVSFFDNNVKLQIQAGAAPPGRFTGTVLGAKLLANVFLLPFEYFLGPDWSFFSMAFALGANFSYFTMDADSSPLVMSAVLLQWEYARFEFPDWPTFRTISLYLEPNLWFASSDVSAGAVFRISLGLRTGIF